MTDARQAMLEYLWQLAPGNCYCMDHHEVRECFPSGTFYLVEVPPPMEQIRNNLTGDYTITLDIDGSITVCRKLD